MKHVTLNNGIKMPILGFGTYFLNVADTFPSVYTALINGYRHLDTAKWYMNEELVANAISKSGIKREELFITAKVESKGYELTKKDIEDTLKKLNTEYLDLILIHWPENNVLETYKALEEMYLTGRAKSIGLSNFNKELCDYIINNCQIYPQVNQIETHIYFQEKKMNKYLNEKQIIHESWAPFAEGYMGMLEDIELTKIAEKYNKSVAQIILKFFVQKNIVVIPKSTNSKHIKENIDIFDFDICETDMNKIESLDKKTQYSGWPITMKSETKY